MALKTKSDKDLFPIGIGTWNIGSVWNPELKKAEVVRGNEEKEIEALQYSMKLGQNHIDTAEMYGSGYTDEIVGQAIKPFNRGDLFIADKIWKTSVAKGKVRPAVERMLKSLQTDYIDLLYIHNSWEDVPWLESIAQIDELIDEGIVLNFGVSNFKISDMKRAMKIAKHPIVANQLYYNVMYRQDATKTVREFCEQNTIKIVAYRPVERKEVENNKKVIKIAKKHNATPYQVALAWLLKMNTLPIPKTTNKAHIDENLKSIDLSLDSNDMVKLDKPVTFEIDGTPS